MSEDLHIGRWWERTDDGRLQCNLCPRRCRVRPGQRAFCFVRMGTDDGIALTTYGRSSGFCVDPIEKKPLNHFLPGSAVLSFGTAGCNLGCRFCQNWDISKARDFDKLADTASPDAIALAAAEAGCDSVAFTYNDPTIFAEYAIDIAKACRERGVRTVAVTAGWITPEARPEFYAAMDAANVDLKGFTEEFYEKTCYARLGDVLDTLRFLKHETDTWFELTTLLIPGANDSEEEIDRMTAWIAEALGPDVPLHFTAFHPDYKMRDRGPTPLSTLLRSREIARRNGLRFVYTGNVRDRGSGSTWCPSCDALLIERVGYTLGTYAIRDGGCAACGTAIPGVFRDAPGTWGSRRMPVRLAG